ncbi:MAG TPA: FAD-dependent oxidoreductase, partial [Aequorivita sp.]|nr:FAD-dependent oxidoreductase [Aequorivita sp.]
LRCVTISYNKNSNEFLGINTFGIRMKHEVFDKWLNEKRSVDYVIENLKQANFDPEFYRKYEKEILKEYEIFTNIVTS